MKRIKLTQGKYALISDSDFKRVAKHKWCAKKSAYNIYAVRGVWDGVKTTIIRMHRWLVNCPKGKEVHHKDGNPLNNQRGNLQITTKKKNLALRDFK